MNPGRFHLLYSLSLLGALAVTANAQFLDNNAGSSIGTGDDSTYSYTLGGAFTYYGTPTSTVGVCTNGFVQIGASTYSNYANVGFPGTSGAPPAMVAPFWDDLYVVNTGFFMNGYTNANYDAFTWHAEHYSGANSSNLNLQAILFRGAVNLQGFNFLAGDIAFSYGTMNGGTPGNTATVGINAGDGVNFVTAPGTVNGTEAGGNIPNFASTGQFFLFRPNAGGGYSGTLSSVPEPASMVALGLGAVALLRRRRAK